MASNASGTRHLNKRILARGIACVSIIIISLIFISPKRAANLFSKLGFSRSVVQPIPSIEPVVQGSSDSSVKGIRFTLHPTGIDPKEVVLAPGRYRIAVDNRTGANEAEIQFDAPSGQALVRTQIAPRKLNWRSTIQFAPGEYYLRLLSEPSRTAKIVVTNN